MVNEGEGEGGSEHEGEREGEGEGWWRTGMFLGAKKRCDVMKEQHYTPALIWRTPAGTS